MTQQSNQSRRSAVVTSEMATRVPSTLAHLGARQ